VEGPHEGKLATLGGLMLRQRSAPIFFRNLACFGINRDSIAKAKGLETSPRPSSAAWYSKRPDVRPIAAAIGWDRPRDGKGDEPAFDRT
jgi:hypothetical protein